jgi:hypothetical protein
MPDNHRPSCLAGSLLMIALIGLSSPARAAEKPRLPQALVLTLELERSSPPSLPDPHLLTLDLARDEEPTEPEATATQDGVTWESGGDAPTQDYEACLAMATQFTKKCDEVAARWGEEDCQRSGRQSGCLLWKVGCFSPYTPGHVFSEAGCSTPGFYQCAAASYPGYVGCVDGCNTAKDRFKCLNERCQTQAKISFNQCGDGRTTGSSWRIPTVGSPDAQPGSDENVMKGLGKGVAAGLSALSAIFASGNTGGVVQKGQAFVVRDGRRIPLGPGAPFPPNVPILTNDPSAVFLPDGTLITTGPQARFKYDREQHLFMPQMGRFYVDHAADSALNKTWRNIKTTAKASYKLLRVIASGMKVGLLGTSFMVETDPDVQIDRVLVHEGTLDVEGKVSGRARVSAGQMVTARNGVLERTESMSEEVWAAERRSLESGGASATSSAASGSAADGGAAPSTTATTTARSSGEGCSGIEGRWRWFNGIMVECFAEGRCEASNGFGGPWKCLDASGRHEIHWARPGQQNPYVDTLNLSSDAWELEGVNQSGQGVGGRRPEFTGGNPQGGCQAILGKWRWSGGAAVECGPDKTCTASNGLTGPWRCVNDKGRFEIRWERDGRPDQFIDHFVISPLGTYLTGKNQHGVGMGAIRE